LDLDERKLKILQAIIRNYMETGEPVGSRTISKYSDLNLSSATIRNEMSDLEEMGYILQPHTSAGRIPSDKGYRLYVDRMMKEKEQEVRELKELMIERTDKMERVLKQVVKVLAANTNYATMVSAPACHRNKLKFIQLSKVSSTQILTVIMMEGNLVRNKVIPVTEELDQETVLKLNILLNSVLNGLAIEEINLAMIKNLKEQAGIHSGLVADVIDAVAEVIHSEEEVEIYTSGTTNIFRYPELSENGKASELLSTFEEKQELTDLVNRTLEGSGERDIQVYIGQELPVQAMKDCSVVTATYELGDGLRGTIGIIGPKRMDYENVVDTLKTLTDQLDEIYNRKQE
jgi:heat-inducible transcriptional repressor